MPRTGLPALLALSLSLVFAGRGDADVVKDVKGLSIRVDTRWAHPGGVLVAYVRAPKALGPASFALDGRRSPVYAGPLGLRALVPVPLTMAPGTAPLGLEIRGARGKRRIAVDVTIAPATFTARTFSIAEDKKDLLAHPDRVRDSRLVLGAIRQETVTAEFRGRLAAPVSAAPDDFFGSAETYDGGSFVPLLMDGIYGDQHRGLDFTVPTGTPVLAPGSGVVLLAQPLAFAGQAVVVDHGRGVVSVFFHLSKINVAAGDHIEAGTPLGACGDTGLAFAPHVHWGVYVHGVAVDPRVLQEIELG
jgi:hypothetical protein